MFGGFGGALKNLTGKAEEALEKTKKDIEGLAAEKKAKATELLESQAKKTGEALLHGKSELEKTAVGVATDTKKAAIDGFDKEVAGAEKSVDETLKEQIIEDQAAAPAAPAEAPAQNPVDAVTGALGGLGALGALGNVDQEINKAVDGAVKEVSHVVDDKMKEADQFVDHKRDEVIKQVQGNVASATQSAGDQVGSVLGKAKGFLKF